MARRRPGADPTIFVQIAAYRDTECKHTVDDLFSRAARPDRINVGICWQFAEEDGDVPHFDRSYAERVRVVSFPISQSKGLGWARSITQSLHKGETFTMQVDAHMRFVDGWDDEIIAIHDALVKRGYAKPVLTCYPPDYWLDDETRGEVLKKITPYLEDDVVRVHRSAHVVDQSAGPFLSACLSGNFFFARSEIIAEVPYDPVLYFSGEEMAMGVRMWTHGWDLFNPGRILAYHLYARQRDRSTGERKRSRIANRHRADHVEAGVLARRSHRRFRHLFGIEETTDSEALAGIEQYGFGPSRTIHQFERYAGFDYARLTRRVWSRAALHFDEKLPLGVGVERDRLLAAEAKPAEMLDLSDVVKVLRPNSVLDLGARIAAAPGSLGTLGSTRYHALTADPARACAIRLQHRATTNRDATVRNYVSEPLPIAELTLVGALPDHLPTAMTWQLLENVKASRPKWLATIEAGTASRLASPPFHLPAAGALFPVDGRGGTLHLWDMDSIAPYLDGVPEDLSKLRAEVLAALLPALERIERALAVNPGSCRALFEALNATSSDAVKELLADPAVIDPIVTSGARPALTFVRGLRWRDFNSAVMERCPSVDSAEPLFVMAFTCAAIEDALGRLR